MGELMDILLIRTIVTNTSQAAQYLSFMPPHGAKLEAGRSRVTDGHLETILFDKRKALKHLESLVSKGLLKIEHQRVLPDGTVVPLLQAANAATSAVEPPTVIQPAHEEGAGVTATPAPSELIATPEEEQVAVAEEVKVEAPTETAEEDVNIDLPAAVVDESAVEELINSATDVPAEPPVEPVVETPKKRKGRPKKVKVEPEPAADAEPEDVLSADTL